MGQVLLVVLLLLFLGGIVVTPRPRATRVGIAVAFGTLVTTLTILILTGVVPWNWK